MEGLAINSVFPHLNVSSNRIEYFYRRSFFFLSLRSKSAMIRYKGIPDVDNHFFMFGFLVLGLEQGRSLSGELTHIQGTT